MTDSNLSIDPKSSALVVIDLQKGVTGRDASPHSTSSVVKNSARLAARFREKHMPVFLVRVDFKGALPLSVVTDTTFLQGDRPADWSEFVPELGVSGSDIVITKRQWGAFYGTDLEQQLRRRKIETIVLCGIATTYGVESTARFAYEYGFNQIFVEDAMTDLSQEAHRVSVDLVLKRMGRVRSTEGVLAAL